MMTTAYDKSSSLQLAALHSELRAEYLNAVYYEQYADCFRHDISFNLCFSEPKESSENISLQLRALTMCLGDELYYPSAYSDAESEPLYEKMFLCDSLAAMYPKYSQMNYKAPYNKILAREISQIRKKLAAINSNPIVMQYDERKTILLSMFNNMLSDRNESLKFNEECVRELPANDFNAKSSARVVAKVKSQIDILTRAISYVS